MKNFIAWFLLMVVPTLWVLIFGFPFSNLTDWQLGLFGVMFALSLIGLSCLLNPKHGTGNWRDRMKD